MDVDGEGVDVIGDIHGHVTELRFLLEKLGYVETRKGFSHRGKRRVLFLGDYIDRGPSIPETLEVVRRMVEEGNAIALMGNHELNALRYHSVDATGQPLRKHSEKNTKQHQKTLDQIPPGEMQKWLKWFSELPLWVDLGPIRAVHACWDDTAIAAVKTLDPLRGETLVNVSQKGSPMFEHISRLLNGPEGTLPGGLLQETGEGVLRPEIRVRWWRDLTGLSCRDAIFPEDEKIPDVPPAGLPLITPYPDEAPPVFFGHYAVRDGRQPAPLAPNVACLDYGTGKGGHLCAYRWSGEAQLKASSFIQADRRP